MKLAKLLFATLLVGSFAALPAHAVTIIEEHVNGGSTQLTWLPGFNTPRILIGATLAPANPAFANPSGDHTVGVLTNASTDSGGIALSCTDPQGQADYTWQGWMFTGDGNTRRGLILRADPTNSFTTSYQFVLFSGMSQLVFRKLINQSPTSLRSWIGPQIPGGIPLVNTWHFLKVEAIGNTFRCWWDNTEVTAGNPIVDATAPLLTGFVGVYNFRFDLGNVPVYFDDLVLTAPFVVPAKQSTWGSLKSKYRF